MIRKRKVMEKIHEVNEYGNEYDVVCSRYGRIYVNPDSMIVYLNSSIAKIPFISRHVKKIDGRYTVIDVRGLMEESDRVYNHHVDIMKSALTKPPLFVSIVMVYERIKRRLRHNGKNSSVRQIFKRNS